MTPLGRLSLAAALAAASFRGFGMPSPSRWRGRFADWNSIAAAQSSKTTKRKRSRKTRRKA